MSKIINFKYNKDIDDIVHRRFDEFVKKNKTIWGRSVPKVKKIISIKDMNFEVNIEEIINEYDKIFNISMPNINGYIVTTPFSMIDDDGEFKINESNLYYSIYNLFKESPSIVIGHELFHIYFEKYTKRNIPNYETAKEYFTVIMNDVFNCNVSMGYPEHTEIREKIFKKWQETKSIDECLNILKNK